MDHPLDVETVLVPVDGSDESVTALEYGVAIADRYDAAVHVLYVLDEEVVQALEEGAVDEAVVSTRTQDFLAVATGIATERDVPVTSAMAYGFSTMRKSRHPGSVILDSAEEVDADFLVIPREPVSDAPGDVLAKAAEYVLLYASQPVLSV